MKKFAALLMMLCLTGFTVGCGGAADTADSAAGETDDAPDLAPLPDAATTDAATADSATTPSAP